MSILNFKQIQTKSQKFRPKVKNLIQKSKIQTKSQKFNSKVSSICGNDTELQSFNVSLHHDKLHHKKIILNSKNKTDHKKKNINQQMIMFSYFPIFTNFHIFWVFQNF